MHVLVLVDCLTNGCRAAVWESADKIYVNRGHGAQVWLPNSNHHSNHLKCIVGYFSHPIFSISVLFIQRNLYHIFSMFNASFQCVLGSKQREESNLFVLFIFKVYEAFFLFRSVILFGLSLSGERDKITDKFFSYTEPDICCALFAFEPNFHWAQCFIRKCIKQMKVYRKHKGPYLFMLQMQSDGIFSNLLIFSTRLSFTLTPFAHFIASDNRADALLLKRSPISDCFACNKKLFK